MEYIDGVKVRKLRLIPDERGWLMELLRADWEEFEERLERIPEENPSHDPEGVTLRQERAVALWQAVDELPEAQREVVVLRYQQGFSYKEIAQTLEISEGTVKSRLFHAHRKLREQLEAAGTNRTQPESED